MPLLRRSGPSAALAHGPAKPVLRGDGTVSDVPEIVLYHARGCHLCDKARAILVAELGDGFAEVDIADDPGLEARYREWLPVVEIDGKRAFVYFVDPVALRRKLAH